MTVEALIEEDLESFENFIAQYTNPKGSVRRQLPEKKEPVTDVPNLELSETVIPLSAVCNVSLHQKIRRAFLETGFFRFDSLRCDINIRQVSNVLEIEIDVAGHPKAKEAALTTWETMRQRIVDAGWDANDLNEVNYVEKKRIVHILFSSDKLLRKITI